MYSFGAFQPYSAPISEEKERGVEVERVERIEESNVEDEKDCEIIGTSKKKSCQKEEGYSKEETHTSEVEVEGEEGNRN